MEYCSIYSIAVDSIWSRAVDQTQWFGCFLITILELHTTSYVPSLNNTNLEIFDK